MWMVWVMVGQLVWAEDFQSSPPGQTPAGWQVLNATNMTHAAVVRDTCHILEPGMPGNPSGNLLLCMDAVNVGQVHSQVDVVAPPQHYPYNGNAFLRLSYDWTLGGGLDLSTDNGIIYLYTSVRFYTPGSGWSSWELIDQHLYNIYGSPPRGSIHGTSQHFLEPVPDAESLQVRFYAHLIDTMGNPTDDTLGATVDNILIEAYPLSPPPPSSTCCGLFVATPYYDPPDSLVFPGFCAESSCSDTFEISVYVDGVPVQPNPYTMIGLSPGECWGPLIIPGLGLQPGSHTIELYDNSCATQPHSWTMTGVAESPVCSNPLRRFRVLVLRRGEEVNPHFQNPAVIVAPDGRVWKVQSRQPLRLPPGSYRFKEKDQTGMLLILP